MPDSTHKPNSLEGVEDDDLRILESRRLLALKPAELATIERRIGRNRYETPFLDDMVDLWTRKRAGGAFQHVMAGKAFELYEQFTRAADSNYYLFNSEAKLIRENPDFFRRGASTAIELGMGSLNSVIHKSEPFYDAVRPPEGIIVDYSVVAARSASEYLQGKFPDVKVDMRFSNFNEEDLRIKGTDRRIMAQFGGTLGNAEGFLDGGLPREFIVKCLTNYRRNLNPGDYFVVGLDQNQDEESLHACYSHELIAKFSMATLDRMAKELPVLQFDADDFEYAHVWNKESHLYAHGFKAKRNGFFGIGGRNYVRYDKGDMFVYCNSYKYPQEFLDDVFEASGFKPCDRLVDPQKRMHIHALEAV